MKTYMKQVLSLLLALLLVAANCVAQGTVVQAASKVTKIVLNAKNEQTFAGGSITLKVKSVKPSNASKKVTWKSSNKKIATVSSSGKVKARKEGTVTITAVSKNNSKVKAKCRVKIYKATKTLKLNSKSAYTLSIGQKQKLGAKVTSPKKGAQPITWSSKNSKVATVNKNSGTVTAVAKGKAVITGKSGNKAVTVTITVQPKKTPNPPIRDGLIKVGIINNDPSESRYRAANDADLRKMFTKENGYEANFQYSFKNAEQIAYAQDMINEGIDYLLLCAADTTGWDTVLKNAQNAGTKVILFDRTIDADESLYEASIVSDMGKQGEVAVNWLAGQGLDSYNIIHIQGFMDSAAQVGRTSALAAKVNSDGKWKFVSQETAEWDSERAKQIVQSVIDSGKEFNVIYAENEDMAKGAVEALDAADISHGVGKDVIIMAFNGSKWALEELLAQNWNYDGLSDAFQASSIDKVIKSLEAGEKITEKTIFMNAKGLDAKTITREDVDFYGI